MNRFTRVSFILALFFFTRIIQSCCECNFDPHPFDFSMVTVRNLDNSGSYTTYTNADSMNRAAIAFEVSISADENMLFSCLSNPLPFLSFESALAFQCDCDILFKPNQSIVGIKIITNFPLSELYPEDSDVSDLFLAHVPRNSSSSFMYKTLEDILPLINYEVYSNEASTTFQIFCREFVTNDIAQFTLLIELSDGNIISGTTRLISLDKYRQRL